MKDIHVTPAITAGAYSALDAVGGLMEFEDARTSFSRTGCICQAHITDKGKQNALLYLVLFNQTFTPTADNAAFAVSDADLLNVVAVIEFAVANYASFNANSYVSMGFLGVSVELPFALKKGGTSLFGQLFVKTSTPTYTSTSQRMLPRTPFHSQSSHSCVVYSSSYPSYSSSCCVTCSSMNSTNSCHSSTEMCVLLASLLSANRNSILILPPILSSLLGPTNNIPFQNPIIFDLIISYSLSPASIYARASVH